MLCHAYSLAQFIMKTIIVPQIETPNVKVRFSNLTVNTQHGTFQMDVEFKQRGRGAKWSPIETVTGIISDIAKRYFSKFLKEQVLVYKQDSTTETELVNTGKYIRPIDKLYAKNGMHTPTVFEAWNDSTDLLECPIKLMQNVSEDGLETTLILSTVHHRQAKKFIKNEDGSTSVIYVHKKYKTPSGETRTLYYSPEDYSRFSYKKYVTRELASPNGETSDVAAPDVAQG